MKKLDYFLSNKIIKCCLNGHDGHELLALKGMKKIFVSAMLGGQ